MTTASRVREALFIGGEWRMGSRICAGSLRMKYDNMNRTLREFVGYW